MYKMGRRSRKQHRIIVAVLATALLITLGIVSYKALHLKTVPRSQIVNQPGKTTHYTAVSAAPIHIDKPLFSFDLPADWQAAPVPSSGVALPTYLYHSPSSQAEQLALYVDNPQPTFAVNRVVTVMGNGNKLDHDTVSDNCTNYTRPNKADPGAAVLAKWRGIGFLCDIGNYQRNVVGIASAEAINQVTLTAPQSGIHTLFIAYTDNGSTPDYTILYNVLNSFTLK